LYCDDHKRAWRRTKKASSTEKARQKYLTNFKNRSRVKPEFSPIAQRSHQHYGVPRGGRWVHPPREDLALQRYSLRKQKRRNPWRGEQRAFAALKIDLLETKNNAKKLLIVYQEIKPLLKRYISANLNFAKLALKHNIRSRWEVKRIQEIAEVKNARNLKEVTWEKLQKKIDALSHLV
jgi:hypothetical protein